MEDNARCGHRPSLTRTGQPGRCHDPRKVKRPPCGGGRYRNLKARMKGRLQAHPTKESLVSDGKTNRPLVASATSPDVAHATTPDDSDSPGTIEPGRGYRSFAPVTEALMFDPRVNDAGLRLWAVLDRQAKGRPVAIDSMTRLAVKLNRSENAVRRAMRNLAEAGWLDIHHRPGRVSRYVLHYEPPPPCHVPPNGGPSENGRGHANGRTPPPISAGHTRTVPSLERVFEGEVAPPPSDPTPNPQGSAEDGGAPAEPATARQAYPRHCPAHASDPNPAPCGPCADARKAWAAWANHRDHQSRTTRPDIHCRNSAHPMPYPAGGECPGCRVDRRATPDAPATPDLRSAERRTIDSAALRELMNANRPEPLGQPVRRDRRVFVDDRPAVTA